MSSLFQDPATQVFLRHFDIRTGVPPARLLRDVVRAFARLPYENLTKILAGASCGGLEEARGEPLEVIRGHALYGSGGTCFSLTATLRHILRELGFVAEPILADRPYGLDTHCALSVELDGRPFLLDPGYLLVEPVPLTPDSEQRVQTAFHEVRLLPRGGEKIELHTVNGSGPSTLRLTFKAQPVDWSRFVKAWEASFDWEMMRYPVLTQVIEDRHVYLQGHRLQIRSRQGVHREEIAPEQLSERIAAIFAIDAGVAGRAIEYLRARGEKP